MVTMTNPWNNTTRFMAPLFGYKVLDLRPAGLIRAYLKDVHKAHYFPEGFLIYMLFQPDKSEGEDLKLKMVMERWENMGVVFDEYDYSGGYTVIVLKFPVRYNRDFELFLEGKYSQFSEGFKRLYPDKITVVRDGQMVEEYSFHHHVFNKTETMRKFQEARIGEPLDSEEEFWDKPSIEDTIVGDTIVYGETLDIDKLKMFL